MFNIDTTLKNTIISKTQGKDFTEDYLPIIMCGCDGGCEGCNGCTGCDPFGYYPDGWHYSKTTRHTLDIEKKVS